MKHVVLALALAACGSSSSATRGPQPTAAAADASKPLDLTMRMRAQRGSQQFGVASEDKLKTGDYLEMFVTVNQPAYVYVVQFFADGTSAVLYPDAGDRLLQPGSEVRIPEAADDLFQLDERVGDENVYVLMSREPASKADAMIASQIDHIRVSGAEPAKPDPPVQEPPKQEPPKQEPPKQEPPKQEPPRSSGTAVAMKGAGKSTRPREDRFLTLTTRNLKKVKRPDGSPTVTGTADKREDALLVVRFTIKHE